MKKGFTLVEVIVALGIISFVSVGVMFSISLSLSSASRIKNNLIAAGLAQEGFEIVRNMRDQDWHSGRAFGVSLPNGNYLVDWNSQSLTPFSDIFLKKDSNGLHNYSSVQDTIFKRKIIIGNSSQNPSGVEKVVKVEVSWNEKSGLKTIQAELRLFNWQ
ncbi:MAG: type II secretion system protein [Patescibacteria group bacterium]